MSGADLSTFDWHGHVRACLDSTYYCALATTGPEGPWVNPVYFSAVGSGCSLLFLSQPASRHMRNIEADPRVAVALYSTDQPPGEHVAALQLEGSAARVPGSEVPQACSQYFARPGAASAIGVASPDPADYQGDDPDGWRFVRVTPTGLWYFNSEFFGEERAEVPPECWR